MRKEPLQRLTASPKCTNGRPVGGYEPARSGMHRRSGCIAVSVDLHGACRGGRDNRRRRCVRVRRAGAGPDRQFGHRYRLRICAWTPTTRFAAVRRKSDGRWALRFNGSHLDFGSETYRVNLSGSKSCGPGGAMTACRYTVRNRLSVVRLGIVYGSANRACRRRRDAVPCTACKFAWKLEMVFH